MSENIIVEIIKGLVSIVVALLGFYAVHSFNQYSKRKNQDEQTEWVSRLIKVATETTEDTLTEETVCQVLSALRPFPHKEADLNEEDTFIDYKDKNGFDEFTDISIKYCNKVLELNTDESLKKQAKKIRLIANILLKYHWEWQDFTTSSTFDSTRKGLKKFQLTFFRYKEYNDKCYKIFEQFKKEFTL